MTDARFPDRWLTERRIVRLSDAAFRLHVTALAWSASNRTDGYLEPEDVGLIHGVNALKAAELVSAGLWEDAGNAWQILGFADTQSTRAQLEGLDEVRRKDRERKAAERARKKPPTKPRSHVSDGMSGRTSPRTSEGGQRQEQVQGQALSRPGLFPSSCPHGIPNGDVPDPWANEPLACPDCRQSQENRTAS